MSGGLFGWNLLYSSVANDIRNNEDVLVCLTHLVMISNGFQCIGLGDSKNMDGSEQKSETLPRGWNDAYALRYVYQGRLYNLQGTRLDDGIMINLIRTDERNVSLLQLNSSYVVSRLGTLDEMIPNNKDIVKMIKEQLLDKVTMSTRTRESTSQTPTHQQPEALRRTSYIDYTVPRTYVFNPIDPVGVGRNDLDPFANILGPRLGSMPGLGPTGGLGPLGGGGGGMLFQPPQRMDPGRNGLPYGSVPPGARFDPFRPPGNDRYQPPRRPNPDNDEFPPPGFDDMYM